MQGLLTACQRDAGFLLEIASVLSGAGVEVRQADIRRCDDCQSDPALAVLSDTGAGISTGRVFKFQVTESSGEKLTEQSVNSVLYTLSMVLGQGFAPTTIPTGLGYVAQSVVNAEA